MRRTIRLFTSLIMVLGLVSGIMLDYAPAALANHNGCAYRQFTRCEYHGYYTNDQMIDLFSESNWLWPLGHNEIHDTDSFMRVLTNDVNRTPGVCDPSIPTFDPPNKAVCENNGQWIGASYIINTMLGIDPATFRVNNPDGTMNKLATVARGVTNARNPATLSRLRSIVQFYDDSGWVDWSVIVSYGLNESRSDTIVMNHTADVTSYINNAAQTDPFIIFHNPDGTAYSINKDCGNVTGIAKALSLPSGFNVSVNAAKPTLTPDDEAPTTASVNGSVTVVNGRVNGITVNRRLFVRPVSGPDRAIPGGNRTDTHNFARGTTTWTATPALTVNNIGSLGLRFGDQICEGIKANPRFGDTQPNGNIIPPRGPDTPEDIDCSPIVTKPYVRTYGYDVFAGISDTSALSDCPGWKDAGSSGGNSTATIDTFSNTNGRGSGSQLTVSALGKITNFSSAVLRLAAPVPSTGLTLANSGPGINVTFPANGGSLTNGYYHCPADFYAIGTNPASSTGLITDTTSTDLDVSAFPANSGIHRIWYKPPGGTFTIHGSVSMGTSLAIYVEGNAVVTNNITYQISPVGWITPKLIPSFALVTKGNISINSAVTELNGGYIAQPDASGVSIINTCTKANGAEFDLATEGALVTAGCSKQLIIRGQFSAEYVKLMRVFGSLRNSLTGENPRTDVSVPGSRFCDGPSPAIKSVCAAELFDTGPEMYMTNSALPTLTGSDVHTYDYFVTLPPVL